MSDNKGLPVGSRMSYWIGKTLREAREHAGLSENDLAVATGRDRRTIQRWEKGDNLPQDIDHALAAYAYVLGREDGLDFWLDAVAAWRTDDAAQLPDFIPPDSPARAFADQIRQERLQQLEDERGKPPTPGANHQPKDPHKRKAR